MKKKLKFPTILGIIILIFGVVAGVVLINSNQVFKIGATAAAIPKNVRVSNITNASATVTWTTDIESHGFVKWGKSEKILTMVALEENQIPSVVHSVNIIGIEPNSSLFIKINSESKDYDNGGIPWQSKTVSTKIQSSENIIASGTILETDGATPAKAIVYLTINGTVLSTLTSNQGNFVIPVSNYFGNVPETTAIEISVHGGQKGTSQAIVYPEFVKSTPTMVLGRSYDFRTLVKSDSSQLPESDLTVPETVEVSSRFEVARNTENKDTTSTLSIESINEGEIITTTDPEFFGSAPANSEIEIQVESELQAETIKTSKKGDWKWSPPNNLDPGEHKLTVKWRDASGILRTISRSFIVSAAEGPAFESTPSATLTPSPTIAATSKPVATSTSIATSPPTPETGSLTPTLGLFIMGIGILMSSILVYKTQNA